MDVKTKLPGTDGGQATQTFAKQHGCTFLVALLQVVMGHGDLEDALEYRSESALGFMPDRLKIIVTFVPITPIKGGHTGMEARILEDQRFLVRKGFGEAQRISVWQACGLAACVNESTQG